VEDSELKPYKTIGGSLLIRDCCRAGLSFAEPDFQYRSFFSCLAEALMAAA